MEGRMPRGTSAQINRSCLLSFILGLLILTGVALLALLPRFGSTKISHPHPSVPAGMTINDLARLLRSPKTHPRQIGLAFAELHRPGEGVKELISQDGTVHVMMAANGKNGHPDGEHALMVPKGTAYNFCIAGHGGDARHFGTGGIGGNALAPTNPTEGQLVLLAGTGGQGHYAGGHGGRSWAGEPPGDLIIGGGQGGAGGLHDGRGGGWIIRKAFPPVVGPQRPTSENIAEAIGLSRETVDALFVKLRSRGLDDQTSTCAIFHLSIRPGFDGTLPGKAQLAEILDKCRP